MTKDEFINSYCTVCDKLYDCDNNFSEDILIECMKRISGD